MASPSARGPAAAFGRRRRRGQLLLRVRDGASSGGASSGRADSSPCTFVEIVFDDMPFLVDTLQMTIEAEGYAVREIEHPVWQATRDARGRLVRRGAKPARGSRAESWQRICLEPLPDDASRGHLETRLRAVLHDVRDACRDWSAMRARIDAAIAETRAHPPRAVPPGILAESLTFLEWMRDDPFVFLGSRDSRLARGRVLEAVPASELGILRSRRGASTDQAGGRSLRVRPADLRRAMRNGELLVISKGNSLSTVHRPDYLDYVGVKRFDARGQLIGERRFLGLWTSELLRTDPRDLPLVRLKVADVLKRFAFAPRSHDGKRLLQILRTLPRDELLQASTGDLMLFARAILQLQERRRVRLLARRDEFRRFHACLVFVPREQYDEDVLGRIRTILRDGLRGSRVSADVELFEGSLVRVYAMVRTDPLARDAPIDLDALEQRIAAAAVTWKDALRAALQASDDGSAAVLLARYAAAFPAAYQNERGPSEAVRDIAELEALESEPRLRLYRNQGGKGGSRALNLRIFQRGTPFAISDLLPVLEGFGLRVISERPYEIRAERTGGERRQIWIQDFELELTLPSRGDAVLRAASFTQALRDVLAARIEDDGFNKLLFAAGLETREILVLRAYARYLLQTGLAVGQAYVETVLARHPDFARQLTRLFAQRFDPALARKGTRAEGRLAAALERHLDRVESLDDDRILRGLLHAVRATLRTNEYQRDDHDPRPALALKLDPHAIPGLPHPVPMFEIFVHSPRVEGVHLRMGHVARGGIRWSDRPQDFRTEILGLMKAQHVKNSLIVPVGAKGGFVLRRPPPTSASDRAALQAEGIACYRTFIESLLDVTDNLAGGRVVPPARVRRHDGDDPYLVVAADKGTATFSDTANAIAEARGFWLGDAFASGGSAGYDHKAMGITARGAWVCVERHFRELGADIQRQDFTVAGIGDMSGDVFGNGMLLSKHIRLVAAFDHRHLFLDPDPDAARSFAERARLAALPRSSWADFDRRVISRGGGVYARSSKAVPLSREVRRMLGSAAPAGTTSLSPAELIHALLRMRVDLLWNGGIGTYVKAAGESQLQVGDRGNDVLRVDGQEAGARVIGEGGNLGVTQRGRIEYALAGGRINTDSIDNSAGVNTSDVEVNYKILLNGEVRAGRLTRAARDRLLAGVTDHVAAQVLRNNYLQSQALSLAERRSPQRLADYQVLMRSLVRTEGLDVALEALPDDDTIEERRRRGLGLTRAELSVLLSWSKLSLNRELLASDVPDDRGFAQELERYFPVAIVKRFGGAIRRHRLRREIIATSVSNSLVNRMGPAFAVLLAQQTGADVARIARAYAIVREALRLRDTWTRIEALDGQVPAAAQYEALATTMKLATRQCRALLQRRPGEALDIAPTLRELAPGAAQLAAGIASRLAGEERRHHEARVAALTKLGLPAALAADIATLDALEAGLDLHTIARDTRIPILDAASAWFALGAALGLDWLRHRAVELPATSPWQDAARAGLRESSLRVQRQLVQEALRGRGPVPRRVATWLAARAEARGAWDRTLQQMRAATDLDFAALTVGIESIARLAA